MVATLRRFRSIDELVRVVALRRDEVNGAGGDRRAQQLGFDRRSALWQAERAVRPAGELFEGTEETGDRQPADGNRQTEATADGPGKAQRQKRERQNELRQPAAGSRQTENSANHRPPAAGPTRLPRRSSR